MCRSLPKEHPEGDWSVILVADEQARRWLLLCTARDGLRYDDKVLITFNYEDAKKQTLAKIGRIYDEILNRFQAASAVLHHNYTNFGTFSRKGALQSGVV